MKNRVVYVFLMLLLVGCTTRPMGVLSHKEMVEVLVDVHIAEAVIKTVDTSAKRIEKQEYYNTVFKKHNITKQQFDKSIDWYSKHHKKLVDVYDDVKLEMEELQERVENYEFHLDMKPTLADSLATFDLWHWYYDECFEFDKDSTLSVDTFYFSITDSNYFYRSDTLKFYLKMRVYAPDSVPFVTRLIYHYSDSVIDTLQYVSVADSVCRRYRFTQNIPSFRDVDSLFIELIDSIRTIERVEVDSVELNRVYNKFLYPIKSSVRDEIRTANDSIKKEKDKEIEAFSQKGKLKK